MPLAASTPRYLNCITCWIGHIHILYSLHFALHICNSLCRSSSYFASKTIASANQWLGHSGFPLSRQYLFTSDVLLFGLVGVRLSFRRIPVVIGIPLDSEFFTFMYVMLFAFSCLVTSLNCSSSLCCSNMERILYNFMYSATSLCKIHEIFKSSFIVFYGLFRSICQTFMIFSGLLLINIASVENTVSKHCLVLKHDINLCIPAISQKNSINKCADSGHCLWF